jgi:hypothetical protein
MEMLFNGDGEQGSRVCRVHIGEVNYQVRERNGVMTWENNFDD